MMNQLPNLNVPVDSLKSVMDEQRNLRLDIEANNKERCELKKFISNLISVCETKEKHSDVLADTSFSDTSSTTCTPKTIKSVESIHHIELSSDDEIASMIGVGKVSFSDQLLQELYVANTRIDANIKVGAELQKRWSELESTVTFIKGELAKLIKEILSIKQYQKIDNLLLHNFSLPPNSNSMSSLEFSKYVAKQLNILLPNLPIPVAWHHISTAHYLPTKSKKSVVVVVRFCNRNVKDMIYANRNFISNGLLITEHLIDENKDICNEARELFGLLRFGLFRELQNLC